MNGPRASAVRSPVAHLGCGQVLIFEAVTHLPRRGDLVPCRRHGHCRVEHAVPDAPDRAAPGPRSRSRPLSSALVDLADFLERSPVTTVHVLRRRRYTLRVLAQAQSRGLLTLDLVSGVVRRTSHVETP